MKETDHPSFITQSDVFFSSLSHIEKCNDSFEFVTCELIKSKSNRAMAS